MEQLTDKQFKDYKVLSRYSSFPFYYNKKDNKYIYGATSYLDNETQYELYKVKLNDTYDSIALKYYNSPIHYWIICDFNRIINCLDDPIPGTNLKIPVLSKLQFLS